VAVVLLLALISVAVLAPPALRAHNARKEAFLDSFGRTAPVDPPAPRRVRSQQVERRRRIAGGLLVAMAATLLVGLLPTFRMFLVVHLFLVDSFLAYIALLAHKANRAARPSPAMEEAPEAERAVVDPRRRREAVPRPAMLAS
jgi:predicted lipid-binding transport protein (Tim44 family)